MHAMQDSRARKYWNISQFKDIFSRISLDVETRKKKTSIEIKIDDSC
jgi:hypothetical protein